jgi:predicted metal-dependent hydrolase
MPKYLPTTAVYVLDGVQVPYVWTKKAVKNYNLRVRKDGSLAVSSPTRTTQAQIERFLADHAEFIRRARERMAARPAPVSCALAEGESVPIFGVFYTVHLLKSKKSAACVQNGQLLMALSDPTDTAARARLFWRFAKEELTARLQLLTQKYASFFLEADSSTPAVALRRMKSRWGACFYRQNRVTYSTNLIFVPTECLAYVVCHELAHTVHLNHGPKFHELLDSICPDNRSISKKSYSPIIRAVCG